MSKKKRRSIFDEFFEPFESLESPFEEFGTPEMGAEGYSIEVRQEGEKTTVHAKVGKDVDVGELKRDLQIRYPGAQIVIEGGRPVIEEVKEEPKPVKIEVKSREEAKPQEGRISSLLKPKEKPLIEEVKEE